MGRSQRIKGVKGQSIVANLLRERDWIVDQITAGIKSEDIIATDPNGKQYSCEVKNTQTIMPAHRKQAMEQAKKRGLPWLLINKIYGTSCWLVQRQGMTPVIWHEKGLI